jgi:hypothetical protein
MLDSLKLLGMLAAASSGGLNRSQGSQQWQLLLSGMTCVALAGKQLSQALLLM